MSNDDLSTLRPGQTRLVGGHLWVRCRDCGKVKRVGMLGGLHWCVP